MAGSLLEKYYFENRAIRLRKVTEMVISELCDALFSLFSKYKMRLVRSPCCLCV
jgi:hypothetical protein